MTDVLMPALSPTMEEGTLAKWHVKKGDTVKSGDVIAEIETDKATMEVEAVDEGVVEDILIPEGSEGVKVNTPIARLAGEGDAPAPKAEAPKPAAPPPSAPKPQPKADVGDRIKASPLARRLAEQRGVDLATLKGSGPSGRIVKADVDNAGGKPAAAPTAAIE